MGAGNKKRYNREFKLQAARLVVELGYTYDKAAKQLGATSWSIRNWVQKFREEGIFPPADQPSPQADELKALQKENLELKLENQILKKAAAYFARESL
jgi:transposase